MNKTKRNIINKLDLSDGFGPALNTLQDFAKVILSKDRYKEYLKESRRDVEDCEGQDCLIINGDVYDWSEFEDRCEDIISSWLDYLTPNEQKILDYQLPCYK